MFCFQALEVGIHPLGYLVQSLVDVYRATYVGLVAHPKLLHHAVQELKSFVNKAYVVVRYAEFWVYNHSFLNNQFFWVKQLIMILILSEL